MVLTISALKIQDKLISHSVYSVLIFYYLKNIVRDFPGDAVVKNPPASAGDMGLSPGLGRSHMPRSN